MMVILFLLVAMAFALVSLSFCIYNARKVPYQSIKGHKGIYLWNCIAGMPLHLFLFYTVSSSLHLLTRASLIDLLITIALSFQLFSAAWLCCVSWQP